MRPQRIIQTVCLLAFAALLWLTAFPLADWAPVDAFLRLDPAVFLVTSLAAQTVPAGLWLALIVLAAALLAGRIFCGFICPMGTCIDAGDRLILGRDRSLPGQSARPGPRRVKYHLLVALLAAGTLGVSFVFLAAPIPLITRLFGLVLWPLGGEAASLALDPLRSTLADAGLKALAYTEIQAPRYASQLFVVGLFAVVFGLARVAPRFWCRHLCPAGAAFALLARRPLVRREVTADCTNCGRCQRRCPMGAIPELPWRTRHAECIGCQLCVQVCPVDAIRFRWLPEEPLVKAEARETAETVEEGAATGEVMDDAGGADPGRRAFLWSAAAGGAGALLAFTGLPNPHAPEGTGRVAPRFLIRPPGALPEHEFLTRCIRCGECMKACPTNTLQPVWFQAGVSAAFSPSLTPVRGPCEPLCQACGRVCPTGALRELMPLDKLHAKVGTAYVIKEKCLAWEHKKKCLVCDEVCPFDAVELRMVEGNPAPVPFVHEDRCWGCGFCEHHCPVRTQRAIVVEAMGEVRLAEGSYQAAAQERGLDLQIRRQAAAEPAYSASGGQQPAYGQAGPEQGLPPGFSEPEAGVVDGRAPQGSGLPPGFSEPEE